LYSQFFNMQILTAVVFLVFVRLACGHAESVAMPAGVPLKIVAFGTSLTESGGWSDELERALTRCVSRPVRVVRIARNGATSDWGLSQTGHVISERPDVILIEFYINDAALNRFIARDRSRANLSAIVDELRRQLPSARIFIMAMNPVSGMRRLMRPWLNTYIEAHRDVAAEKGIEYIDHQPLWLLLTTSDLAAAIPDGLHPVAKAAVQIIVPELVDRISDRACSAHHGLENDGPSRLACQRTEVCG
jgi:acyl-CoA thioesterase-1